MRPVIGTEWRESNILVYRAIICVTIVANVRCHVVKNSGNGKPAECKIHLLKMMIPELMLIHALGVGLI